MIALCRHEWPTCDSVSVADRWLLCVDMSGGRVTVLVLLTDDCCVLCRHELATCDSVSVADRWLLCSVPTCVIIVLVRLGKNVKPWGWTWIYNDVADNKWPWLSGLAASRPGLITTVTHDLLVASGRASGKADQTVDVILTVFNLEKRPLYADTAESLNTTLKGVC